VQRVFFLLGSLVRIIETDVRAPVLPPKFGFVKGPAADVDFGRHVAGIAGSNPIEVREMLLSLRRSVSYSVSLA